MNQYYSPGEHTLHENLPLQSSFVIFVLPLRLFKGSPLLTYRNSLPQNSFYLLKRILQQGDQLRR